MATNTGVCQDVIILITGACEMCNTYMRRGALSESVGCDHSSLSLTFKTSARYTTIQNNSKAFRSRFQ